jgi:hypothetical protein
MMTMITSNFHEICNFIYLFCILFILFELYNGFMSFFLNKMTYFIKKTKGDVMRH